MVYIKIILFVIYPIICHFILAQWVYKQEFKKVKTIKDQYDDLETRYNKKMSDEYETFRKKISSEYDVFRKELRLYLSDLDKKINSKNKEYLKDLRKTMSKDIDQYLLEMNNRISKEIKELPDKIKVNKIF